MTETIAAADIVLETDGLDPAIAARLLARRAAQIGRAPVAASAVGAAVLVWTLGAERFALPLAEVASVLPTGRVTPVPGAPAALMGLASRRGRLINVVDPAPALGQGSARAGEGHLLVLGDTQPRLALRVDRAEGVATLAGGEADNEPAETLTRQALLADGGRLLLVDKERLVEALGLAGQRTER
jgi:purine-binding chemotaxis protein CheW